MGLFQQLHKQGLWRGYSRHVVALEPVLRNMSIRGMPVDKAAFDEVVATLEQAFEEAKAKMQELVPYEVKQKKGYKQPKADGTTERVLPWTPSSKGLVRYMVFKGHPVPKHIKTRKNTTNQLEIIRLYRKTHDPLYKAVIDYRKAQTVLTNHVKNWKPGVDERVHPVYYMDPATGQLSARRPNTMNAPKHDDPETGGFAQVFRTMIKPPAGKTLMEFDYRAFHVQTLGFEAQDADMMRMGRLDIHSFVTAHFLKLGDASKLVGLPDDELRERLARVKKEHKHVRDAQCKHALLGYNNGMGYRKLYLQYMEFFQSQSEAKQVMDLLDHLFPKSKSYRERIVQQAHEQGYLISRHGYIRYFWEVFRYKGRGEWGHGDDAEAALCFFTQNDAHGELKDRILAIAEHGLDERYGLLNCIHDSLIFECPSELVLDCRDQVREIMEAPSKILIDPVVAPRGLSVEVEVVAGPHWAAMKGI